nr:MAG TPA: Regulatory protein-modification, helix-turn-helix, transcriptional regulato, DNA [Caudoviricetes sp.]
MKKFSWSVLDQAAYRKVTQLIKQSGYSDRTMAAKIGDIVSYNRIRDIRLDLKAPVRMSEYLAICDACGADPVQTLREIITEARRMELEQQTASTKKPAGERFVVDGQSPEAGHEDIDIDAWADRIKAEDKVNVE